MKEQILLASLIHGHRILIRYEEGKQHAGTVQEIKYGIGGTTIVMGGHTVGRFSYDIFEHIEIRVGSITEIVIKREKLYG